MAPLPNHLADVQRLNLQYPQYLQQNTIEACGKFTEILVWDLSQRYPAEQWGHVGKVPGQTQYNEHAVDAIMSKLDLSKAVDIIGNAHNPPGKGTPLWDEVTSGGQPWKDPFDPNVEEPVGCNCKEEIADLQNQIDALNSKITELGQSKLGYGDRTGLKMDKGMILAANEGGGDEVEIPVTFSTRDGVGPWETFELVKP